MFRFADAFFHGEVLKGEIGVEIELEGSRLPVELPKYWTVTRDGSLRGEAYEYVFSQPIPREDVKDALSILYARLEKAVLEDSGRAGVHVHINIRDLSVRQLYNFILLYLVFEKNLVDFCGEDRVGNLFCLRATDAEYLLVSIRRLLKTHDIRRLTNTDNLRYAAMNLTSLLKYGSLEFRAMASPVGQDKILDWVDLLLCIKDYAKQIESPTQVVLGVSELGGEDFASSVFKDKLPLLTSKNWRKDVIEGMRLIQPLANAFDSKALDDWEEKLQEKARKAAQVAEAAERLRNGMPLTSRDAESIGYADVDGLRAFLQENIQPGSRAIGNLNAI